ncbi:DUF2849 domain-containing protein [Polycladidibacter stylochi]|uniref:DUF2849 domain-containing protein n=1 Tax=Polycladidibacter stylochi TaxID=1807766 RepID=UPI0008358EE2|nr:DUF2849 domain-containing protein [Pseudovibrio stylochi]
MKLITANRLLNGEVVWLGAEGQWVSSFTKATPLETAEQLEAAEKRAQADSDNQLVLGAYSIEVCMEAGEFKPVQLKEVIRAQGPTTRLDLGKQASSHQL